MFYDVKTFNAQGEIKRIVSAEELSRSHWNAFQTAEANKTLNSSTHKQVPAWVKKKLDREYVLPWNNYNPAA